MSRQSLMLVPAVFSVIKTKVGNTLLEAELEYGEGYDPMEDEDWKEKAQQKVDKDIQTLAEDILREIVKEMEDNDGT